MIKIINIIDKNFISNYHIIYINNKDKFEQEIYLQLVETDFNLIQSITGYIEGKKFCEYCVQIIGSVSQLHSCSVEGNKKKQWKDKNEYEERLRKYKYDKKAETYIETST